MASLRTVFMGSPGFAVPCLEALRVATDVALVVTQPDKPAGRGQQVTPPAVKEAASRAGLPVLQPPSLRTPSFAEVLRPLSIDLAVVVAYGKILPPEVLAVPRLGCWNIHASLLPKYRGAAPIQRALLAGETETGVTLMRMDEGMDTGAILRTRAISIGDEETSGTLHARLADLGATLLLDGLAAIASGALEAVPQDDSQATLAPRLDKEAGRIDWSRPASRVRDQIRAVDPWPGAYTFLDGNLLKMWSARVVSGGGAPGTVIDADREGLLVACGEGAVAIRELQLSGRKRMPAAALLAGRSIPPGTRLGP